MVLNPKDGNITVYFFKKSTHTTDGIISGGLRVDGSLRPVGVQPMGRPSQQDDVDTEMVSYMVPPGTDFHKIKEDVDKRGGKGLQN